VSTLADWLGAAAATLMPLVEVIRAPSVIGKVLQRLESEKQCNLQFDNRIFNWG
jgi:hypothetical protein